MFLAWYEQEMDLKNHIFFHKKLYTSDGRKNHLPHFHGALEIAVGLKGNSEVYINGNIYALKRGAICFMNSFDVHRYHYISGTERYVIAICTDILEVLDAQNSIRFPPYIELGDEFEVIKSFLDFSYDNWDSSPMYQTGFANMLLGLLLKYCPTFEKDAVNKYDEIMVEAVKYINQHSQNNITVEEVASKFGYSPNYFSNLFNKFMGVNFREYLNFCRFARYKKLRSINPKLTVEKASELCGFGSLKSFYRAKQKIENTESAL